MERIETADTAIVFENVVKHFRCFASPLDRIKEALHPTGRLYHTPVPVLRGVNFSIPRGQTVAVLGPNGVGKSTLLHLAAGILETSSGVVKVTGSLFALLDLTGSFAPELTGRENVRFFHDVVLKGAGDRLERERIVQEFAEIGDYFDRPVRTYSTGMFLRLAFATAISAEPDILLIDEVIAVGDARFQQKCFRRIRELHDGGTTILLVTHTVEVVTAVCDRVLLFDHGELVFDGDPGAGVDRYYELFFKSPTKPTLDTPVKQLRYGSGDAKIGRSFASLDGVSEALSFKRGERVTIVMEVEFERAIAAPQFGLSCSTKEGIRVYATTTMLLREYPAPAYAGERRRVEIAFDLSVAAADLFIDLSVFEMDHGSFVVLDAQVGVLHLAITTLRHCGGVVDLDAGFAESILQRGDDDREDEAELVATGAGAPAGFAKSAETFAKSTGGAP
jgi:ABC-type polysaccharide/polyol phosphate transport system ATPase subunit